MTLRSLALLRLLPLAIFLVSPAVHAQELFTPSGAGDDAPL